ncbi:MAG: molybdopterin molybdotransferase MoeA [Synergistaceae bacterium]|nr:molybdopterin molybdotransferase MoeA [Synergistaceae bacterium]
MSGFAKELISRKEAIEYVSRALDFPWALKTRSVPLEDAMGKRSGLNLLSPVEYPPFTRSTRDGYALRSADVAGASDSAPVFLRIIGEVPMGEWTEKRVGEGECVLVHTGGMIPEQADSVVMLEDTVQAGTWLEVRKALQSGENLVFRGEEIGQKDLLLKAGDLVGDRNVGLLATLGICTVEVYDLKIGILSTGDEIVPAETPSLPPGKIRDANAWFLEFLLARHGFSAKRLGIVPDIRDRLAESVRKAMEENDIVVLSGGSSVSVRDFCSEIMENLPSPGLLVRGINMSPGKPALIAGCLENRRLVLGLPGHPLSCSVVAVTVLLPLLYRLAGLESPLKNAEAVLVADLFGKAGVEEFIPAILSNGEVLPIPGKSGYVSVLKDANALVRLAENEETRRKGEKVEVLQW